MKAIQALRVEERPRERLCAHGVEALEDAELLAAMLGSGGRSVGVHVLAQRILAVIDARNGGLGLEDLLAVPGVGRAKASLVLSALEFARRRIRPRGVRVRAAEDVLPLVRHWAERDKEHFLTVTLNGAHEVIETRVVTVGLVNASQIHPREVFADAISDRACALVCAHNHPSGNVQPSDADRRATRVLAEAGQLLGIRLLDHVIFSRGGYFSFQEAGEL